MEAKSQGSLDELYRLLAEFDSAMLVTVTDEHLLRSRPMSLPRQPRLPDCDLWLFTSNDSDKVGEIDHEHQVNLCCLRGRDHAYLSISAEGTVSTDAAEIQRLWQPDWRIWVGDDADHSAALLKLTIERAEYWLPEGGRPRVVYRRGDWLNQSATAPDQ